MQKLSLFAVLVFFLVEVNAQKTRNLGFEEGNTNQWTLKVGRIDPGNNEVIIDTDTSESARHLVVNHSLGIDSMLINCGINLPFVSPGSNYSLRLGNGPIAGNGSESISRKFTVDKSNAYFRFWFAVVLQDPKHEYDHQPRFEVYVKNPAGEVLECGSYSYRAQGVISGFKNCGDLRIRPWTLAGIDLTQYIGDEVTIEFLTTDCAQGGHFGYAYIDVDAAPLNYKVRVTSDTITNLVTITAPEGFYGYQWMNGDTSRTITLVDPPKKIKVSCNLLINDKGCFTTFARDLKYKRIPLKPAQKHIPLDTGQFAQVFRTDKKKISLRVWDNERIDGDKISVFLNNTPIAEDITVTRRPRKIRIRLNEGENEVEVQALNQNVAKNTAIIQYRELALRMNAEKGTSRILKFIYRKAPEKTEAPEESDE